MVFYKISFSHRLPAESCQAWCQTSGWGRLGHVVCLEGLTRQWEWMWRASGYHSAGNREPAEQDQLRHSWGLEQNESQGPLVQKVFRMSWQQHEALNQGQGAGGGPGITVRAAGLGSCLLGAVRGMNLAWTNCNLQSSLVYLDCTWSVFILWLYYFLFKCKILKYIFWSFVGYWQGYFFEKKKKLYVIKYTNYPTKQKLTPETTPPESLLQTVGEAQSMIQGPSL